jgi:hypothetical protein
VRQRLGERLDVVQRRHRHGGVERLRFEVEQRDGQHVALAARVDGGHVVPGAAQHRGERAVPGTDLEHPRGGGWQGGTNEGDGVRSRHGSDDRNPIPLRQVPLPSGQVS